MSRSISWVRRPIAPIGIDLGTRFVRMLQVARHKGQITVTACAQHEIPAGAHSSAELAELHVQAVRTLLARGTFAGREAVIALPWDQLQIKNIRIPPMPEEDLAEAVGFEAADRFGLDRDKSEIRFMVAGDVRQGTEVRQEVIVLAAESETIDAHIALLAKMGLKPAAIDAAPCALFRAFERFLRRDEDRGEANVFIDLGYGGTRVIASRGPELIFVKEIPLGGRHFDELVAESLSLPCHDAERLRRRLRNQSVSLLTGIPAEDGDEPVEESVRRTVLEAIRPALEQLSKEIALCVRYCAVTFRGPRADAVTVVGGEASDPDLLQVLTNQVNIPFHTGRPTRNLAFESGLRGADRRTGQPEWATALGLAIKPTGETDRVHRRSAVEVGA